MTDSKSTSNNLLIPVIFAVVLLVPLLIAALVLFNPSDDNCDCTTTLPAVAHTHGTGLTTAIQDDMQLIFNVSPAAELYQLVDGQLELCGGDITDADMKHVTVDVYDARIALGERLPVDVSIEIRAADDDSIIVQAGAPAMYALGHGYHFGDNLRVPNGAAYTWTVTISPVNALRQPGTETLWLGPITWSGTFDVAADGSITGKSASPQLIGNITDQGVHIALSVADLQPLYEVVDGVSVPVEVPDNARYFVVDVTDHAVNYEEKLPGAAVTATFRQGDTTQTTVLEPVISPTYGYHYGANVALEPGEWTITIEVGGLEFVRHAGAAVSLGQRPVTGTFEYTIEG